MSTEAGAYFAVAIAGGLALGLAVGAPAAWAIGLLVERYIPKQAQHARLIAAAVFVLVGALLWYRGALNFLIDAAIIGVGIGFLVDAARRARPMEQATERPPAM